MSGFDEFTTYLSDNIEDIPFRPALNDQAAVSVVTQRMQELAAGIGSEDYDSIRHYLAPVIRFFEIDGPVVKGVHSVDELLDPEGPWLTLLAPSSDPRLLPYLGDPDVEVRGDAVVYTQMLNPDPPSPPIRFEYYWKRIDGAWRLTAMIYVVAPDAVEQE